MRPFVSRLARPVALAAALVIAASVPGVCAAQDTAMMPDAATGPTTAPAPDAVVGAITEHDVIAKLRAFEQQFAVEAYAADGHRDAKWDADAVALIAAQVDAVAEQSALHYRVASRLVPAARGALAASVVAAGCDDAMALYMAGLALRDAGDPRGAVAALRRADAAAAASPYCSLYRLRMLNDLWKLNNIDATTPAGQARRDRLVELMRETFTDRTILPAHRRAVWNFAGDLFDDGNRAPQLDIAEGLGEVPDADPWLFNAYRGHVEVDLAWEARGSGWGATVTEEGWEGFRDHLALARERFAAAMAADPTHPHPYAQMIAVAMGDDSGEQRRWFDAALERQLDHHASYGNYFYSLLPRWGGTHSEMYDVGLAALADGRFDTRAPAQLIDAVMRIERDQEYPLDRRQLDKVYPPIMQCVDGYLANADRDPMRAWAAGAKLAWSWRAGRFAEGKAFLDAYQGPLDDATFAEHGTDRAQVIGETTLMAGPSARALAAARGHRLASARAPAYDALLATLAPDDAARPWLTSLADAARFEASLESGEWTPVVVPPDLKGWTVDGGRWEVEPDGALVGVADGGLMIVRDQPLPERYEVRFTVESADPEGAGLRRIYVYPAWSMPNGAGQYFDLTKGESMLVQGRRRRLGEPFAVPVGAATAAHFAVDARAGTIASLDADGQRLGGESATLGNQRRLAFGGFENGRNFRWRFKGIEIRLPKAK